MVRPFRGLGSGNFLAITRLGCPSPSAPIGLSTSPFSVYLLTSQPTGSPSSHGPRAEAPPGETKTVALYTAMGVGASLLLFMTMRMFGGASPPSMNREWQEAANERLREQKADPLSGISSEGYSGKGQIQSPPAGK